MSRGRACETITVQTIRIVFISLKKILDIFSLDPHNTSTLGLIDSRDEIWNNLENQPPVKIQKVS